MGMFKIASAVNPRCKYRLNFVPSFSIYKRFMTSRILNALIFYNTFVIGVYENLMECFKRNWLRRNLRC